MKRITDTLLFLFVNLIFCTSCVGTKAIQEDFRTETYKNRMADFSRNPLSIGQIVFFGNSITQAGEWSTYFPDLMVANRGISGDNTEGMLARIDEIANAKPKKFFIMAGINDISLQRSNKKIVNNYRNILRTLRMASPETEIYIQSVLPINNDFARYRRLIGKEKQVVDLNNRLRRLAEQESGLFINLYPYFINPKGKLRNEFTNDGLHLTSDGYMLWVHIIQQHIK